MWEHQKSVQQVLGFPLKYVFLVYFITALFVSQVYIIYITCYIHIHIYTHTYIYIGMYYAELTVLKIVDHS